VPSTVSSTKKTGKDYLNAADQIIASGQAEQVAAALAKLLSQPVTVDRESLGKAISLNEARKRAEENKRLATAYINLLK